MELRRWTKEELSPPFTAEALVRLGVNWPPIKGWRRRLLSGDDPNAESLDGTFARLDDGMWAVRVPCASREIRPGLRVTVVRKDGTSTVVRVERIVKQGSNYSLCTFY
jgi:hypothetical protein